MYYCENCKSLIDINKKCSFCGYKKVREAKENDAVYLTTKIFPYSGMLEDILTKNQIPHLTLRQGLYKATSYTVSPGIGEFKFFVPLGAYEEAKELLKLFFEEI